MILPDVNILLYAFRKDAVKHNAHREWLEDVMNGLEPYGISPQTLASVIRIGTHPTIHVHPSTMTEALDFCAALMEPEQCTVVQPGPQHWRIFSELCQKSRAAGNLVSDAWFAALAIEAGCEWITTDRDYARFPGLRWREPF
jgi:toxin-antitoxin system PIN domain toxin